MQILIYVIRNRCKVLGKALEYWTIVPSRALIEMVSAHNLRLLSKAIFIVIVIMRLYWLVWSVEI